MGFGTRLARPALPAAGDAARQARQWNGLIRVAQGLGDQTGVWIQGFVRRTAGRLAPAIVDTPAGLFDDGVYDDPYASELAAIAVGARHILAGGAELQASGFRQDKDFKAAVALDAAGRPLAGDPLRVDRITRGTLGATIPLAGPNAFALAVTLEYGFTRSRSNDAFYDYSDHAIGLALTLRR
jgi:hypothetical protein